VESTPVRTWIKLGIAACGLALGACAGSRAPLAAGSLATANADAKFGPSGLSVAEVQSQVMSFTETFISAVAEQWGAVEQAASTATGPPAPGERDPEQAARAAHEIKLANVASALSIASHPNPIVAAADIVTLLTLQRMSLEQPWAAELFGDQIAASLLASYREEEAAARRIGAGVFFPAQEQELLDLINTWHAEHPNQRYVSGVRMEDFGRDRSQVMIDQTGNAAGLFSLVDLDTATREVERSRLLGERVFFYAEHLPTILRWQAESVYLGAFHTPQVRQTVGAITGASAAADRLVKAADALPQDLAGEREAALNQFFQSLTEQRQALLKEIDESQAHLQGALKDLTTALAAADALATKLTPTINAANELASKFAKDNAPAGPPRDVLAEYKAAADATAQTAERLTALTTQIDRLLASPAANGRGMPEAIATVQAAAQQVVDHAFWRLLIVACVAPLLVLAVVALARRPGKPAARQ
jgi:hypothetical protein